MSQNLQKGNFEDLWKIIFLTTNISRSQQIHMSENQIWNMASHFQNPKVSAHWPWTWKYIDFPNCVLNPEDLISSEISLSHWFFVLSCFAFLKQKKKLFKGFEERKRREERGRERERGVNASPNVGFSKGRESAVHISRGEMRATQVIGYHVCLVMWI